MDGEFEWGDARRRWEEVKRRVLGDDGRDEQETYGVLLVMITVVKST